MSKTMTFLEVCRLNRDVEFNCCDIKYRLTGTLLEIFDNGVWDSECLGPNYNQLCTLIEPVKEYKFYRHWYIGCNTLCFSSEWSYMNWQKVGTPGQELVYTEVKYVSSYGVREENGR